MAMGNSLGIVIRIKIYGQSAAKGLIKVQGSETIRETIVMY
jgi:hypothetical protein